MITAVITMEEAESRLILHSLLRADCAFNQLISVSVFLLPAQHN